MKKMFSAKKVQMLTLMLLCGTTAVMAQNSAGDYSAGFRFCQAERELYVYHSMAGVSM